MMHGYSAPPKRRKRNFKPTDDDLAVYDGRDRVGTIQRLAKGARAFDLSGNLVGTFPTSVAALRAIAARGDG